MNEKDVSHPFMTMILTCVTMVVRWADVPDSDWGDFRRRCAVDISSLIIVFPLVAAGWTSLGSSQFHDDDTLYLKPWQPEADDEHAAWEES